MSDVISENSENSADNNGENAYADTHGEPLRCPETVTETETRSEDWMEYYLMDGRDASRWTGGDGA